MVSEAMLPRAAVKEVEARLTAAGCPDADFDARELFRLATGRDVRLSDRPLTAEQAAALKDMGRVDVRLAKGFDQSIRMSVVSVSREENGQAAVVLSSTRYLAQTTLLRHQAADAVLHTYQGLRVPADARRGSAARTPGGFGVGGANAAFRPVARGYQGAGG